MPSVEKRGNRRGTRPSELPMESGRSDAGRCVPAVQFRTACDHQPARSRRPPPTLRKARALIAYLALSTRAVSRAQLCELRHLPNDPRGELAGASARSEGSLGRTGKQADSDVRRQGRSRPRRLRCRCA